MTREQRLCEAITEALQEMEGCPDDGVHEIWNDCLEKWETGLRMHPVSYTLRSVTQCQESESGEEQT